MAGGYFTPPKDDLDVLRQVLQSLKDRVAELERPTGTQTAEAVKQLRALVEDLQEQIDNLLSTAVNTGNVTATGFGHFGGEVTAGGNASVAGTFSAGGVANLNPGIVSSDVKSRVLAIGYNAVYIDVNNRMGLSPSSRRFKQDIETHEVDFTLIDQMVPRSFRLIGAVEVMGDAAPREVGFIAEELDELGFGEFVTRDSAGTVAGIAYDRLTVPLVAAVKQLRADVADIRAVIGLD